MLAYCPSRVAASIAVSCLSALVLLFGLVHVPAALAHEPDTDQCTMHGVDRSQVLPNTVFDARLAPFGAVCFLARRVPLAGDPDQSKVIDFELWHDGTRVYHLPRPEPGLWPPACDSIAAVAFPARGALRDIIVIGKCLGASDEQAQPLVYRASQDGFTLDAELSTALIGVGTVQAVELHMHAKMPNQRQ